MEGIHLFDLANLATGTPGAVNFRALHTLLHVILKHLDIQDVQIELPEGGAQWDPPTGEDRCDPPSGRVECDPPSGGVRGDPPSGGVRGDPPSGRVVYDPPLGGVRGDPPSGRVGCDPPSGGVRGDPPSEGVGGDPPSGRVVYDPPLRGVRRDPQSGGVRGDSPSGGVGGDPPSGGVGGDPPSGGVEGDPPSGGVGGDPPSGGVGGDPPSGGVGGDPPSRGVGGDPPSGGVGGDPPSGGVGGDPPSGGVGGDPPSGDDLVRKGEKGQEDNMERRILHLEEQLEVLNKLPSGLELMEKSKSVQQGGSGAVSDMWQMMQLRRRVEMNEEGVCKAMTLLQDLMTEMNTIKEAQRKDTDIIGYINTTIGQLQEKCENLNKTTQTLIQDHEENQKHIEDTDVTSDIKTTIDQLKDECENLRKTTKTLIQDHDENKKHIETLYQEVGKLENKKADKEVIGLEAAATPIGQLQEECETLNKTTKTLIQDHEQEQKDIEFDALHGILTTTASPSSTLLAISVPGQSDSSTPGSTVAVETTCPAGTIDIVKKFSKIGSQFEDLQNLVTDYTSVEATGTDLGADRKASEPHIKDIIGSIKTTIGQLQDERENLNKTTIDQLQVGGENLNKTIETLIQDYEQTQKHIETLYQEVGKLENKKADREVIGLEIDLKADKCALERKVSYSRFDVTTEHLGRMIEDLLEKVDAHEEDWQSLLEKINVEMQNKLDRMEIDPLKNILEQRWKDLCRQLQQHPPQYEADEAAGIRRQLMTRFHCISCDRPVYMKVPGPLQSGTPQPRREASQPEMSLNHRRGAHTHMRQEISRVQLQTSGKICHLLPAHDATQKRLSRTSSSNQGRNRLPDLDRSRYRTVPRNCGGSHTLTFTQKNLTKISTSCTLQKRAAAEVGLKERPQLPMDGLDIERTQTENHP
ncbi:translation initiation factor IF-2-like [Hyla sarda]|uniref:translation initiation factor IF-2-like n=1 Tax=Hyla sarda TaxID=327740 RepID=UPI0024C289B4|nr:translation initiation factor IF-2-like [Hyla sarda]